MKDKKAELQAKLPKVVDIFGKEFKIVITNLRGLHGDCNIDTYTIRLHQSLDLETAKSSLFHETLHAAFAVSGHNQMMKEDQEEALVRMLEQCFFPIVDTDKFFKK